MSTDYHISPQTNLSASTTGENTITHYIRIYENFLSHELCDQMIHHLHSSSHKAYQDHDYLRREESALNLYKSPDLFNIVRNKIIQVYNQYKQDIGSSSSNLFQCNTLEFPNIVAYKPSSERKEQFSNHVDGWHFDSCSRQISIIMYLSDLAEGGSTTFPLLNYKVNPVKGKVLVFPSNFMFMHCAEPPISDVKYACIAWLHFDGDTKYISTRL